MTAMAFFTGIDGLDTWNWSGTGSHQVVAISHVEKRGVGDTETTIVGYHDVMVAREFSLKAEDREETFKRYDVLHVVGIDQEAGVVRFQKIRPGEKNNGADAQFATFGMPREVAAAAAGQVRAGGRHHRRAGAGQAVRVHPAARGSERTTCRGGAVRKSVADRCAG